MEFIKSKKLENVCKFATYALFYILFSTIFYFILRIKFLDIKYYVVLLICSAVLLFGELLKTWLR